MYSIKSSGINIALAVIFSAIAITACKPKGAGDVEFNEFPKSVTLEGRQICMPDSEIRVLGTADVVDDGYAYYLYDSPYTMSFSDKDFSRFNDFAPKGEGPGEVEGVSALFVRNPSNDRFTVYDPYQIKIYDTSPGDSLALHELISFPDEFKKYSPTQVFKLKDGSFVGARGDFKYGLVSYSPESGTVTEWPLGGDFDTDNPVYKEVSKRAIGYNEKNGVIAEIYGLTPTVFIHDENGDIVGRYRYTGYESHQNKENKPAACYMDIKLTDNYIWLLYGDVDESDTSKVFALDYDGNPVAEFTIKATYAIAVDEQKRRLLSINPNEEEDNLVVYDLPDFLWK